MLWIVLSYDIACQIREEVLGADGEATGAHAFEDRKEGPVVEGP